MISVENVSFSYGDKEKTLKNINLEIQTGECILLCGESGCGKTTVTKLINGLIPHFCEKYVLEGNTFLERSKVAETELYELAKSVGSVFQNPKSQFFNLDTDSELAFGMENEGMPPDEMELRLKDTIEKFALQKLLNRNIFTLSGGEKQNLAFASVYAMNPSVYVLDEPTANLDTGAVERLKEQIAELKKEGHTIIIAEHRLYFLYDLIDWAFYMKKGEIVRKISREEFHNLTEKDRIEMGLRSIEKPEVKLLQFISEGVEKGLSVQHLTCGYKKEPPVFQNLSFSAIHGEILAITGYNGIGKTTLIRCLCGLKKEREGEIYFEGKAISAKIRRKNCFLVMQDVNHQLFSDSVWEECKMADAQHSDEEIKQELNRFGLLPFQNQHPMSLSGGQKQRLAVATAVLSNRQILIFDEPTSGLDYNHMKAVAEVIRNLADTGHIILVVTHDREFMQFACDRVLEMR